MSATKTRVQAAGNGGAPAAEPDLRRDAIEHEEQLREEAAAIWAKDENADVDLQAHLLRELRPLLRKPIPRGFIETIGKTDGKPYPSTGVKSVQVQMDRLDNVLGPENWGYEATHTDDGKRCYVQAWIGPKDSPLVVRDSWGGMNRGSTEGNLWKGSFTNAAKPALARLGPAWEVYVGAADFDPDTDPDAADQQATPETKPPPSDTIAADQVARLMETFASIPTKDDKDKAKLKNDLKLKLGSIGVSGSTVGQGFAKLTPAAAAEIDGWLSDEMDRRSA